jgi:hypothetical protein
MEIKLYKLLRGFKYKLTKQQYSTIKGQIKNGDYIGAYKGIMKLGGNNEYRK